MSDSSENAVPTGPAPYSVSREDAAERLEMSTRSVDRYIRRGRLRAKKVGKMVWIHADDLSVLHDRGWQSNFAAAPESDGRSDLPAVVDEVSAPDLSPLMDAIEKKLEEKDQLIQDLSYRLGKAEIELKNSIPLVEHKKVAFLLEDAKRNLDHERNQMENKIEDLSASVNAARIVNGLLLSAVVALMATVGYVWYLSL